MSYGIVTGCMYLPWNSGTHLTNCVLILSAGVGFSVEATIWRRRYVWPWGCVMQSFNLFI